jgi:septum formation protein
MSEPIPVILASGSATRAKLLRQAGLEVTPVAAAVDEESIKASFAAEGASVVECATVLAEMKATRISARYPGALVIGADQILDLAGRWFDKPETTADARAQLLALRGKTHELVSASVVALNGSRIWADHDIAYMKMRDFTESFLDHYLARAGADILGSVGAYHYEGLGAQLFDRVTGDYYTILGLPLLRLLEFLRGHGVVAR